MIELLENIHTIKVSNAELMMVTKAIRAGVETKPERFSDQARDTLLEFADSADKAAKGRGYPGPPAFAAASSNVESFDK